MADIYGGRVLAGEDSEEDDEDEEEMSFQFNGFGSQGPPAAPRFAVPTVVAPPSGNGGEEDEESDEEEEAELQLKLEEKTPQVEKQVTGEEDEEENEEQGQGQEPSTQKAAEEVQHSEAKKVIGPVAEKEEDEKQDQELWQVDENVNGIEVMSNAFVDTVQPSLDATIHRIAELKESQQRLLKLLTEQNAGIKSNKQLEDAAVVLEKLPFYVKKLQGIKLAMQEISVSTEKMKRRAEGLRIDAQSYAIEKENKRDAQSQWNKLYAAKSAPSPGVPPAQS
ncbi:Aspartate-semialdehyde dehydrogenase [Phytophthora cinnamomi]|uniref:Aspartate-semialdehyde dehydrogenase n=1 Tax=Phytophthora cinnamomi TaxID=4785 RepID=UPI00355AA346|nr:Aspartate-semialdehyde dehydrogenase [Phytophthora cinnamomi]